MKIDLNRAAGENEPLEHTELLMPLVSSANIACGGHAGSAESMRECIRLALQNSVRIGASPGLPPGADGAALQPRELATLLLLQVSGLETLARGLGARLHHIKLHASLRPLMEEKEALRESCLKLLQECWPTAILYAPAGGALALEAREHGFTVWNEIFLDRQYLPSGQPLPSGEPNAFLTSKDELLERLKLVRDQSLRAADGTLLRLEAQTFSIEAEGPRALEFAAAARHFPW